MKITYQTIAIAIVLHTRKIYAVGNDGIGGLGAIADIVIPVITTALIIATVFFIIKGLAYMFDYFDMPIDDNVKDSQDQLIDVDINERTWIADKTKILDSLKSESTLEREYAIDLLKRYCHIKNTEAKLLLQKAVVKANNTKIL